MDKQFDNTDQRIRPIYVKMIPSINSMNAAITVSQNARLEDTIMIQMSTMFTHGLIAAMATKIIQWDSIGSILIQ